MIVEPKAWSHWSGFDLPGRELGQAEATAYARACWSSGTDAEVDFLAVQIATMTALDDAFEAVTERIDPRSIATLVPWREPMRGQRAALGSAWEALRAALAALDLGLARLAPGTPRRRAGVRAWWRHMAERQVDAFACEAAWRVDGTVPDLRAYLRVGQRSIGVEWTAASLVALDPSAGVPRSGDPLRKAIAAIARTVRIANDLHDPQREREEGKVQWLLLRSRALVSFDGLQVEQAEAVAARELKALAAREAASAKSILRGMERQRLGGTALRTGLEGLLGVGLATYVPELAAAEALLEA